MTKYPQSFKRPVLLVVLLVFLLSYGNIVVAFEPSQDAPIFSLRDTTIEVIKLLLFILPFGILFVRLTIKRRNLKDSTLLIPMYFLFGLATLVITYFLFALVIFNKIIVLASFIICLGLLIIKNMRFNYENKISISKFLIPLLILTFSLIIFIRLAFVMEVAPPLDSLSHGMFTSLILYHEKLPTTFEPIGELSLRIWAYPKGFHLLSALTSLLNGTPPVRSMLILATLLIAMLPPLFYVIVYLRTKSMFLSLIAFFLPFILPSSEIPMWRPGFDILLSNYIVGIYPNILGNFIFLGLIGFSFSWERENDSRKWVPIGVLMIALFFAYYPLFIIGAISLYVVYIIHESNIYRKIIFITGGVLGYYVMTFLLKERLIHWINFDPFFVHDVYLRHDLLSLSSIYWYYLPVMVIGACASLYLLIKKAETILPIFTLTLVSFQVFSLHRHIFTNFLWFTYPERTLVVAVLLSFVSIVLFTAKISRNASGYKFKNFYPLLILLIVIISSLFFQNHLKYEPAHKLFEFRPTDEMYQGLKWIVDNTKPDELILNDPSITGQYLPSFRAQAVINDRERLRMLNLFGRLNGTKYEIMVNDANQIFQRPMDFEVMPKIAERYGIKYVFLANIDPYDRRWGSYARGVFYGIEMPYKKNTYTAAEYQAIFDSNPYLIPVYRNPSCVVYKTLSEDHQ